MVNFNFGLGANDPQDGSAQTTDPATTQDPATQDDTAAVVTPPEMVKPVTDKPAPVAASDDANIQFDSAVAEPVKEETPVAEAKTEEKVDTPTEAPTNPFAAPAAEEKAPEVKREEAPVETPKIETTNPITAPAKVEEVKVEEKVEEVKEEAPVEAPVEAPANPFGVTAPTEEAKAEEVKENTEEAKPETPVQAPVNPFGITTDEKKEEKVEEVKDEEKVEEKKEEAPAEAPANPFGISPDKEETPEEDKAPEKKEAKPDKAEKPKKDSSSNAGNYDPMATIAKVKQDIVAFVDFHKKNIKVHEDEIRKLEVLIRDEKKLLKEKGDGYAKMLKELHGLTQNFGGDVPVQRTNGNRPQPNKPHNQNRPRPVDNK